MSGLLAGETFSLALSENPTSFDKSKSPGAADPTRFSGRVGSFNSFFSRHVQTARCDSGGHPQAWKSASQPEGKQRLQSSDEPAESRI